MNRGTIGVLLGMCIVLSSPAATSAATIFIDFEAFTEGEVPSAPGVTFTNTAVLTSETIGGSLNATDFPPQSDFNVGFDFPGGPMILEFSTPVVSFSGYFTYVTELTLTAFRGGLQVDTTTSSATANYTSAPGTPNELLLLASAAGITRIEILGAPEGGSFVVDDIMLETAAVPEPATIWLLGAGAAVLVRRRAGHRRVA